MPEPVVQMCLFTTGKKHEADMKSLINTYIYIYIYIIMSIKQVQGSQPTSGIANQSQKRVKSFVFFKFMTD